MLLGVWWSRHLVQSPGLYTRQLWQVKLDCSAYSQFQVACPIVKKWKIYTDQSNTSYVYWISLSRKFDWSVCFLASAMGQETWNCMYTCELWPIDVQLLTAVAQPRHWQVTWFECNTIKCVLWLTSLDPWLGVCVGCRWRCQDWWSQGGPCAGDWGSANQGKTPADVRAYVCMQADAEVNCFLLVHLSTCCLSFAQIIHSSPYLSVLRTSTTALHSCMYVSTLLSASSSTLVSFCHNFHLKS